MRLRIDDIFIVPYGTDRWAPADFTVRNCGDQGLDIDCNFPCVAVADMTKGLRLNSAATDAPAGVKDDFAAVAEWTASLCGVWDGAARRAVAHYFQAVEDAVEARRDELTGRLARYEGLFDYSDFRFSAPRPLPRAHLFAPPGDGRAGTVGDFVRVDLAWFPGAGRVTALLSRTATAPPLRRTDTRIERLKAAGVEVGWLEDFSTAASFDGMLAPMAGGSFLDGEILPCGLVRRQLAA